MDIKDALAINSNGEIIDSFEHDLDLEEYLVVDLFSGIVSVEDTL